MAKRKTPPIKIKRIPPIKKILHNPSPHLSEKDLSLIKSQSQYIENLKNSPYENQEKSGRPTYVYHEERTPKLAFHLVSKHGLNREELASFFNVIPETIDYWQRTQIDFLRAVTFGRQKWDSLKIEGMSLRDRAMGYDYLETKTEFIELDSTDAEGNSIKVPAKKITQTTKHQPADIRAIKFWLINRERARWKNEEKIQAQRIDIREERRVLELSIKNAPLETLEKAYSLLADLKPAEDQEAVPGNARPKIFLPETIDVE